ncbi:amino acid ABC transporter substrate-binding protein (plasmid) [Aminobacter sp. Y103A]|uniref:transporter substrate-binding domain-containing protein n=1 Tax=Aminobacter sp. Y103A TaxID=1870862 RepID=UPI002574409A|nr:transporter substrate-binding domain-containing protein [Aminobacter sp. SS-2016]BBD40622.1 amino acid ABC transporter substrate-binding protein [Aminobacter sp. SS-2016]
MGSTGEPWRVGVLFSQSGDTGAIEETQLKGTMLGIAEINAAGGINGREIVPIIYDPTSSTELYSHYARKLLIEDRVTTIFGCYTSTSRKAVLPLVERVNALLWYPTRYEGFEFSPNIIYTGSSPNQNTIELINYLLATHGNRFYLLGTDYCYPRRTNRIVRDLVCGQGGTIVGEEYLGFGAGRNDFRPIIRDLRNDKPDVIFSTVVGQAISHFYQAYTDAGFSPDTMPIGSLNTCEAELRLMGTDVGAGHITAATYFESVENEENDRFVRLFKQRFGEDESTNMCAEAAYFQVHLFAQAVTETNSMDTDTLRPAVLGREIAAPQGRIGIDYKNSHAELWTRIGRADGHGRFDILRESKVALRPDPFLVT